MTPEQRSKTLDVVNPQTAGDLTFRHRSFINSINDLSGKLAAALSTSFWRRTVNFWRRIAYGETVNKIITDIKTEQLKLVPFVDNTVNTVNTDQIQQDLIALPELRNGLSTTNAALNRSLLSTSDPGISKSINELITEGTRLYAAVQSKLKAVQSKREQLKSQVVEDKLKESPSEQLQAKPEAQPSEIMQISLVLNGIEELRVYDENFVKPNYFNFSELADTADREQRVLDFVESQMNSPNAAVVLTVLEVVRAKLEANSKSLEALKERENPDPNSQTDLAKRSSQRKEVLKQVDQKIEQLKQKVELQKKEQSEQKSKQEQQHAVSSSPRELRTSLALPEQERVYQLPPIRTSVERERVYQLPPIRSSLPIPPWAQKKSITSLVKEFVSSNTISLNDALSGLDTNNPSNFLHQLKLVESALEECDNRLTSGIDRINQAVDSAHNEEASGDNTIDIRKQQVQQRIDEIRDEVMLLNFHQLRDLQTQLETRKTNLTTLVEKYEKNWFSRIWNSAKVKESKEQLKTIEGLLKPKSKAVFNQLLSARMRLGSSNIKSQNEGLRNAGHLIQLIERVNNSVDLKLDIKKSKKVAEDKLKKDEELENRLHM